MILLADDCGTGAGGFKSGNSCSKGGVEDMPRNSKASIKGAISSKDGSSEQVNQKKGALRKIAEGARMKAQYGVSKAKDIANYLQSPEGKAMMTNVGQKLKIVYKGAIGVNEGIKEKKFVIIMGALLNPVLGANLLAGSAIAGAVRGGLKEYRNQKSGMSARLNAITFGDLTLLAKAPSDEEIAEYITDEVLVAIKEQLKRTEFTIITTLVPFRGMAYDPSQDRDESGKWTSGGQGSTIIDSPKNREEAIARYDYMESEAPHRLEPIAKYEEGIKNLDYERGLITDQEGNKLVEKGGDRSSVSFTEEEKSFFKNKDAILTHNHPQESGLSGTDYFFAIANNLKEIRAVAKFRTFTAERPKSGWPDIKLFQSFMKNAEAIIGTKMEKDLSSGKITTDYANRSHHHLLGVQLAKVFKMSYKVNQTK